jgi:hypothetical protein
MRRSDIFEEFVKIAQDRKLISNDSEKSFKALENNPRADSLDVSAIAALYGVKPETIPDMKYKNNIMEIAHKEPVVLSPAYDRLNGLVENNIERQNINLRIVNKNPDGLLTQRKYAEKQFLLSLVRVANDLDNRNKEKLRKLADNCLQSVAQEVESKKSLKKEALKLRTKVISGLLASLVGAAYVANKLPAADEGYEKNYSALMDELNKLTNPSWLQSFFAAKPSLQFKEQLNYLADKVVELDESYLKFKKLIENIDQAQIKTNPVDAAKNQNVEDIRGRDEAAKEIFAKLLDIKDIKKSLEKTYTSAGGKTRIEIFDTEKRSFEDKGLGSSVTDLLPIEGGWAPFNSAVENIIRLMDPYIASVERIIKLLEKGQEVKNKVNERMSRRQEQPKQEVKPTIPQSSDLPEI